MKQRITFKQLEELNPKQEEKLMEWFMSDKDRNKYVKASVLVSPRGFLMLSIGEMIEFILDNRKELDLADNLWISVKKILTQQVKDEKEKV